MPSTYGIVYATASKALRRIVIPDSGTAIGGIALAAGKSLLVVLAGNNDELPDWENHVFIATGAVPPTLTCAVIDNTNTVQGIICADAAIDSAPAGLTMVQTYAQQIRIGCTYVPATGLFWTEPYTIPAHSKGNPSALPLNVPAAVIPKP